MFDLTSSKLLILGIVALLVVGPKDFPILLRTIGKYVGMIKKQAAEFRSQFDEAMRDAELQQLKNDVEKLGEETQKAVSEGTQGFQSEIASVKSDVELALADTPFPDGPALPGDATTTQLALATEAGAVSATPPTMLPEPVPAASPSPAEVAAQAAAHKSGA